ncbi:acyltransferase [Asticcacaulis sp. BYS171W]|uniref:Acyltransferase n=1 Tax=Asticcacaulis aquaticus TaxID=2984212 RepID=A0ABT5HP32_9CAUL|nr:acyltransferase [Asticcacaulis aquaticus]MDC7681743.1 acyltransferase [Asticcacaulis aquaticus]
MPGCNSDFFSQEEVDRMQFGCIGDEVLIHKTCIIVDTRKIFLGNRVRIDANCLLSVGSSLLIGNNVHLAAQTIVSGHADITIEEYAGCSFGVKILSSSDDFSGNYMTNPTVRSEYTNVHSSAVRVSRHAIIGAGSVVLPGVTIGEGGAIGSQSLVNSDTEAWSIYAGVPVKRLRARSRELLDREHLYKSTLSKN